MISDFNDLDRLFEELDSHLDKKVHFYVIGGAMLLYHGLKTATKDIDMIVESIDEFLLVQNTLKKLKFIAKVPTLDYKKVNLSQIYVRDDFRIDLFQSVVCQGFCLSETMKKRAQKVKEMKHLSVFLCSHEDVFLFKTFTERPGDITDCIALAQEEKPLDWRAILNEIQHQIQHSGNKVWITWIGERLDVLEEKGLEIPVMKEIDRLEEEYYDGYEKEHSLK